MIAFCWAIPFLIILPSLTGVWGRHGLDCKTRSCTIIDANDGSLSFKKFLMSVGVAFPSLILIVIHLMIYEKVRFNQLNKGILAKIFWAHMIDFGKFKIVLAILSST